jgi:hypothetical protein
MRILGKTSTEGYNATVWEDSTGRCFMIGDLDVDADGANGQNGKLAAYRVRNDGSEDLVNGGMAWRGGKVVGVQDWWKDIVYEKDGQPFVLPNGVVPSKTAYTLDPKGRPEDQLDSETIPYIVLPPFCVTGVKGIVKGCRALASYKKKRVECVVGDIGPRTKVGEGSIELCRQLGIRSSPRNGGLETPEVIYEWWPGQFGTVHGTLIPLMSASGKHIYPSDNDKSRTARSD